MTKAEVICDSVSPDGVRLTTFVVVFHRFVLAELNTHRVFSRNSASSRAIPIEKMLDRAATQTAMPVAWGSNKPGMQAGSELQDNDRAECQATWGSAAGQAVQHARHLSEMGLHKQVANRLLEPFLWHTAVITAVDFDNYFWQRCHPDAQPEMKAAADVMQLAYYRSEPELLPIGSWHLPFIDNHERSAVFLETLQQISVARCARVSYDQHDGNRALSKDVELYERLTGGMHASPFEHVATPCTHVKTLEYANSKLASTYITSDDLEVRCKLTGNFGHGWHQYRKFFEWENRTGFVPNHPELIGN
jgi:thymidylate synthase ThyX